MAVYERSYRPFRGALTPERSRFLVIPRYAYKEIFAKKMFIALFVACFIWPAICAILIYLPHNVSFLKMIGQQLGEGQKLFEFDFDAGFFMYAYMFPQSWWSLFIAFVIGPELISADLRNNAMPLYLSRPFSRTDYVLGKSLVMVLLLSLVTWVPGLLLFLLQGYLTGGGWIFEHLRVGIAIFVGAWVWIAVLCLISLSLSAYVKWKPLARLGLIFIFFVAGSLATLLNFLLQTYWADVINLINMIRVVWSRMFGLNDFSPIPTWAAWTSLILFCAGCIVLLARRVRAYEVIR